MESNYLEISSRINDAVKIISNLLATIAKEKIIEYLCSEMTTNDLIEKINTTLAPYLDNLIDSARHPLERKEKRWTIYTVLAAIRDRVVQPFREGDPDADGVILSVFRDISNFYRKRVQAPATKG